MSSIPVPIEFRLPTGWEQVDPEEWGVVNTPFMAVRRGAPGDYVPVLTITGDWRLGYIDLTDIAEESVTVAQGQADEVKLLDRQDVGSERAPGIVQMLALKSTINAKPYQLRQGQVLSSLIDINDPSRRVVVLYTVTCTEDQFPVVGREFQAFMTTVKPVQPEEEPTAAPE